MIHQLHDTQYNCTQNNDDQNDSTMNIDTQHDNIKGNRNQNYNT